MNRLNIQTIYTQLGDEGFRQKLIVFVTQLNVSCTIFHRWHAIQIHTHQICLSNLLW